MVRVEYSKVDRDVAESNLSFHLKSLSLNGLGLKGYRESVYNLYLNRYVAMLKARPVATEDSSEVTLELQDNSNAKLVGEEKEFSFLSSITNSMKKDINISISDEDEEDLFEKELREGVSPISPSGLVNRKELSTTEEDESSDEEEVIKPQTPAIDPMLAYSMSLSSPEDDDDEIDYGDEDDGDDEIDYGDDDEDDGEGGDDDEDGEDEIDYGDDEEDGEDEIDYGDDEEDEEEDEYEDEDEIDYGDDDDYDEVSEDEITSPNQEVKPGEDKADELEFDLDEDELEEEPSTQSTSKPVDAMVSRPNPIARPRGSFRPIRRPLKKDVGANNSPVRSSTPTKVTSSVGSKGNSVPKPKKKDFDRGYVKEKGGLNPLDFDMTSLESLLEDFDSSKIVKDVTKPKPSKFQPKGVSKISYEKGMSLREFLRANPRCPIETAEKYFKKAEIKKELQMGRVMKKGNILFI